MKKWLLAFALFLPSLAHGQCTGYPVTPNLSLGLPPVGSLANWGTCINNNFTTIDALLGGTSPIAHLAINGTPGTQPVGIGNLNLTTPLLSTSDITSITSTGSNFIITCPIPACGLTNGVTVNLGLGLPAGCADQTGNTNNASGNTIQISNTGSCTANAGPYHNQLGQVVNAVVIQSGASGGLNYDRMQVASDGHYWLQVLAGTTLETQLSMQSGGTASLASFTHGIATWADPNGLWCIGNSGQIETACVGDAGVGWNQNGLLASYAGLQSDGQSFFCHPCTFSGNTTGNLTNTNFFTAPASGLGGNTMYHIKGVLTETSAVASATAFVTVTFTPRVGSAVSISSCSAAATNLNCTSTTGVATAMAAVGAQIPFDIAFELGNSQTVSLSVTTANSPVYDYFYQLVVDHN